MVSPKVQLNVYGLVPPDAVAVKVTGLFTAGLVGVKVNPAETGRGATVMDCVELAVLAFASLTVTVTVYVPLAV